MTVNPGGLSLGAYCIDDKAFIELRAVGKLSHDDYLSITPLIEDAIAASSEHGVDLLVDAREFDGWEPRAAWDDIKLGIKHRTSWRRVALVGNKKWEQRLVKLMSWFIAGETKYFEDTNAALNWIGK